MMEGDLIQLIDDDDDQLLEVPLSEPADSAPDRPPPSSTPSAAATTSSRPPTISASVAEAGDVCRTSQPPSYSEANRCEPNRPVVGCVRIGLLSISILYIVISVICIGFNVVGIIYCSQDARIGHGIWIPFMVGPSSGRRITIYRDIGTGGRVSDCFLKVWVRGSNAAPYFVNVKATF